MRQQDNLAQRALEVKKQTQSGRRSKDLPSEEAIPSSSLRQEEKMVRWRWRLWGETDMHRANRKNYGPTKIATWLNF
jgi:hypothetical protein